MWGRWARAGGRAGGGAGAGSGPGAAAALTWVQRAWQAHGLQVVVATLFMFL